MFFDWIDLPHKMVCQTSNYNTVIDFEIVQHQIRTQAQAEEDFEMDLFSVVGLFAKAPEVLFGEVGFHRKETRPNYFHHTYFHLSIGVFFAKTSVTNPSDFLSTCYSNF